MDSYIKRIFGDKASQFAQSKVLLVGAGGIGCELLKDLIMMGYGEIHVLDLDTIDLSNLNRQFLFRQRDIRSSKSLTAIKAVAHFTHNSKLVAHHGNIMDTNQFPLSFFQQFDLVFNALDNIEARMYVNRICLFTKKPLMESGTTGLKGQVEPIYPYLTECFACTPKPTPKSFPVCTIRSTPSKPIHCITWAKNFLFPQLFGPESVEDLPAPDNSQTDAEKQNAKREADELGSLREKIVDASKQFTPGYLNDIVDRVYRNDIEKLLRIEELWKSRSKPIPLQETYQVGPEEAQLIKTLQLSDQVVWSVLENLQMLAKSAMHLTERLPAEKEIEFDKDDEDTLQFVTAASNLRSFVFGIPLKSEFEIKQIAGNIIPAVATTNAIMAGFSGLASIHYLLADRNQLKASQASRTIYDSNSKERFVNSMQLGPRNPNCKMCSVTRGVATMPISTTRLGQLRSALIEKYGYEDDVSIAVNDSRLLYDYDFEDNLEKPLSTFVTNDQVLLISDSEDQLDLVEMMVNEGTQLTLPELVIPPFKSHTEEEEESGTSEVEEIDDDIEEIGKEEFESKRRGSEVHGDIKRLKGSE